MPLNLPSRRRGVAPALAVLTLALAGCASAPSAPPGRLEADTLPTLAAPADAQREPGLSIERWWTLFGDAELEALIDAALRRNNDLAVAAARVREARAQLDEARGAQRPALDLEIGNARARQAGATLPPGTASTGSQHSVSLVGRYEIDLWGRIASAGDAARARLLAQTWARAAVEWGLTAQLAEAHFSLRAVQRQIEIGEAVRESRAATLVLRRRELAAGANSEFELRRAEAEQADAEVTLASLARQRVALEATLALLSGRPPAELAAAEAQRTPLDVSQASAARLPAGDATALLLQRPDLRQAEAQLAAARADVAAARAATLPALRLSGSVGSDVRSLSALFDGPGFVWSLALSATQSIFDAGQSRARVEQADARAEAALAAYRQAVLNAVVELREAYAALDITQRALRAERERVTALDRALELAQTGQRAGAIGQLDVLDAQRNAFSARLAEATAMRDRLIGQVAAYKALGGGHATTTLE